MELKHKSTPDARNAASSLNRTFYGIETCNRNFKNDSIMVLIVPFMELKRLRVATLAGTTIVLIVPFMGPRGIVRGGRMPLPNQRR